MGTLERKLVDSVRDLLTILSHIWRSVNANWKMEKKKLSSANNKGMTISLGVAIWESFKTLNASWSLWRQGLGDSDNDVDYMWYDQVVPLRVRATTFRAMDSYPCNTDPYGKKQCPIAMSVWSFPLELRESVAVEMGPEDHNPMSDSLWKGHN